MLHHAVASRRSLLLVFLLLSAPSLASPHAPLTRAEYKILFATNARPPPPPPPPPATAACRAAAERTPLVIVPDLPDPVASRPRLLPWLFQADDDDPPHVACAPRPYSRIAHCLPLPAPAPATAFMRLLEREYGYVEGVSVAVARYAAREAPGVLGASAGAYATEFRRRVDGLAKGTETVGVTVVAHGYGCVVAAAVLAGADDGWRRARVRRLLCGGGPLSGSAAVVAQVVSGHVVRLGGTAVSGTMLPRWDELYRGRVDMRRMAFSLGLHVSKRRKSVLPRAEGAWDRVVRGVELVRLDETLRGQVRRMPAVLSMMPVGLFGGEDALTGVVSFNASDEDGRAIGVDQVLRELVGGRAYDVAVRDAAARAEVTAPRVPITCAYGTEIDTPGALEYDTGVSNPPKVTWVSGDGIVAATTADVCMNWSARQEEPVAVEIVPRAEHHDLIALASSLLASLPLCQATSST